MSKESIKKSYSKKYFGKAILMIDYVCFESEINQQLIAVLNGWTD